MKKIKEILKEMDIKFEVVTHPPAFTTEEADKYIEDYEGIPSKTIFLTNRKETKFYMIITKNVKRLNIKKLNEVTGQKLKFAKDIHLNKKMNSEPGIVSLFGLIYNDERDINVFIDKELLNEEIITFFPNENTSTFFISIEDMLKFLENLNYNYEVINI